MDNPLRNYVQQLPDVERRLIIDGHKDFERSGVVGNEPLRIHARCFINMHLGSDESNIVLWMDRLAFECYRYYADLYVNMYDAMKTEQAHVK